MKRHTKPQLLKDLNVIFGKAAITGYGIGHQDIFAFGYLAGKYGLDSLVNNQDAVLKACAQYDETDDLMLLDTVGECLIDLEIIKNDGSI